VSPGGSGLRDPGRYPVPARVVRVDDTVRRSRFVTTLARAPTPGDARDVVAAVRREFPDATHHCWAFVAGPPGSTTQLGMSDDGEPQGTAGRPMLHALLHGGVGEVVAVCARWYGGVKLGTGGLGRAYAGGVKRALGVLPTTELVERVRVRVTVGYSDVETVQRLAREVEVVIEDEVYAKDVTLDCGVPEALVGSFTEGVREITRGRGRIETL